MNREQLIERFGIEGANLIEELQTQIAELHEYLDVVRVAYTRGFRLEKNPITQDK